MPTKNPYEFPPVTLLEASTCAPGDPGTLVRLRELVDTDLFREAAGMLTVPFGVDAAGEPLFFDIAKLPHLLIGGGTGTGKSIWLHSVIACLLYRNSPDSLKLLLIDPKKTEFEEYDGLPHLARPIVRGRRAGIDALDLTVTEMQRRLRLADSEPLPRLVVILDELADLMWTDPDKTEESICRLAQQGHKVGIHLLLATQSPGPDVLTGLIRANILPRLSFTFASPEDYRQILGTTSAKTLNGRGDMLLAAAAGAEPVYLRGAYISGVESARIAAFLKAHNAVTSKAESDPE